MQGPGAIEGHGTGHASCGWGRAVACGCCSAGLGSRPRATLGSRSGRPSFPVALSPEGPAFVHPPLFPILFHGHFACKRCFLFAFRERERVSFVAATELLDELSPLMSIYGVLTVYRLL